MSKDNINLQNPKAIEDQQNQVDRTELKTAYESYLDEVANIYEYKHDNEPGWQHAMLTPTTMAEMNGDGQKTQQSLQSFQKVQKVIFAQSEKDNGMQRIATAWSDVEQHDDKVAGVVATRTLAGSDANNPMIERRYQLDMNSNTHKSSEGPAIAGFRSVDLDRFAMKNGGAISLALYKNGKAMKKNDKNGPLHFTINYNAKGEVTDLITPLPVKFSTQEPHIGYIQLNGEVYTLPVTQAQYEKLRVQALLSQQEHAPHSNILHPSQYTIKVEQSHISSQTKTIEQDQNVTSVIIPNAIHTKSSSFVAKKAESSEILNQASTTTPSQSSDLKNNKEVNNAAANTAAYSAILNSHAFRIKVNPANTLAQTEQNNKLKPQGGGHLSHISGDNQSVTAESTVSHYSTSQINNNKSFITSSSRTSNASSLSSSSVSDVIYSAPDQKNNPIEATKKSSNSIKPDVKQESPNLLARIKAQLVLFYQKLKALFLSRAKEMRQQIIADATNLHQQAQEVIEKAQADVINQANQVINEKTQKISQDVKAQVGNAINPTNSQKNESNIVQQANTAPKTQSTNGKNQLDPQKLQQSLVQTSPTPQQQGQHGFVKAQIKAREAEIQKQKQTNQQKPKGKPKGLSRINRSSSSQMSKY